MTILSTENGEHYLWGDDCSGWHLLKSKSLSIIEEMVPSGCSEVRHYHTRSQQFFYILSGVATLELEGEIFELSANQGIHVPAGKIHQLSNLDNQPLRFLVTSTPPAQSDRVEV